MTQRLTELGLIARHGFRQVAQGLQGKAFPLAQLHDAAWFDSEAKKLPTVSLEELIPGITQLPIRLERSLPKVRGNVTVEELAVIAYLCQWLRPHTIFEFGTYNGRTTLNLAANSPEDATIHTLDLATPSETQLNVEEEDGMYHLGKETGSFFGDSPYRGKIEQIWGDSARFDETALRGQVDLIFVDGAHSYEYARSDSNKALTMKSTGGIILWHDYCAWYPGVTKAIHELLPGHSIKHVEATHLAVLSSD